VQLNVAEEEDVGKKSWHAARHDMDVRMTQNCGVTNVTCAMTKMTTMTFTVGTMDMGK
jgi:hypothetical protein